MPKPDERGVYLTNFFNQSYQLVWPHNTLSLLSINGLDVPVASDEALQYYRQQHQPIAEAYQIYLQQEV